MASFAALRGLHNAKADMPFIVSGPLPLITGMLSLMTGHNWPVDPLAGSPEDVINSAAQDCQPFAIPGLPVFPILFPLCQWEVEASTPTGCILLARPSFCTSFTKGKITHSSAHLQAEVSRESNKRDSSFIHLEVKNSTAKPILSPCSMWRANQTSWVCKTKWKFFWKKTNQILPVVFSHLHSGLG